MAWLGARRVDESRAVVAEVSIESVAAGAVLSAVTGSGSGCALADVARGTATERTAVTDNPINGMRQP
jgi:hypothetical protein